MLKNRVVTILAKADGVINHVPRSGFMGLGIAVVWGMLALLAFGVVTIPQPFLATLTAFFLLLIWPGLMLQQLFRVRTQAPPERLVFAFILSFGLWAIPSSVLLLLHSDMRAMIWTVLGVTLFLTLLTAFVARPREVHVGSSSSLTERIQTTVATNWSLAVLWTAFTIALVTALVIHTNIASPFSPSDRVRYMGTIREFLDTDQFGIVGLFEVEEAGRTLLQIWPLLLAVVIRIAQVDLLGAYVHYVPPLLIILSFFASYVFVKELFNSRILALLAVLLQMLLYLSDISGNDSTGYGFFVRMIEDKFTLRFVLLPLALGLTLRFLKGGSRAYLIGVVLAVIALAFVHPIGLVLFGIASGLFFATTLLCDPRREKLVRVVLLVAVMLVMLVVPFVQRLQEVSSPSSTIALTLEESLQKRLASSRLTLLSGRTGLYIAEPGLIAHPLTILAIVLIPWLLRRLRTHLGAQFTLSNMIGVLVLCYVPVLTVVLGKLVTPGMIWRVLWLLPVPLVIAYALNDVGQKVTDRFWDGSRYGLSLLLLGIILVGGWLLRSEIAYGLEQLAERRNTSLSAEEIGVLTYLREHGEPGSLVITPRHRLGIEFRGMVGHSFGTNARHSERQFGLSGEDLSEFYAAQFVTDKHLDALQQGPFTHVILDTGTKLASQFEGLSNTFDLLYANQDYELYQWQPELTTEAEREIIEANTYLSESDLAAAKVAFWKALQQAPEHPLAFIGLGAVAEAEQDSQAAFNYYRQAAHAFPEEPWLQAQLADVAGIDPAYLSSYLAAGEQYRMEPSEDWQNSSWSTYDFLEHLDSAHPSPSADELIRRSAFVVGRQPQGVLFQHPPSQLAYTLDIPESANLSFSVALAPEVSSLGRGDGVQFDIYISDESSRWHLFSEYIDPKNVPAERRWHDHEIPLSLWAGQAVTITFVTDPGPDDDSRYDWAGWGEPRIVQPIAYDFLAGLGDADLGRAGKDQVWYDELTINHKTRAVLIQEPSSRITYPSVDIPEGAGLHFGLGVDPAVWSLDHGDGVQYTIYVRRSDEPHVLHQVFDRYVNPKDNLDDRHWLDETVDLSTFKGQAVDIIFEASTHPAGGTSSDWGGWSMPVLVANDMTLQNSISQVTAESRDYEPQP